MTLFNYLTSKTFGNMHIIDSSFWPINKSFGNIGFSISPLHQQLFLEGVNFKYKSVWHEDTSCMELQAMHFITLCVVLEIHTLHFVQTSWPIKLSSSMLSNVISFVSFIESKSLLEIFIGDKAFCCSFSVVRVVLLSFFWLL